MSHEPKPLPTGNKLEDRHALHKYNKAHIKQSKQDNYNKRNVDRAREIAHEGTYTSKRNLIPGFDGIKVMNSETTEQIPQKEGGPYSFAQQEINNLGWVIENKNISDQERSMLESAKLQLINRMELGITQDQTWMNQIARSNDPNFFAGRTPDKEPDLSNYENFAEFRRGANQDLSGPTADTAATAATAANPATPPDEEVETELTSENRKEDEFDTWDTDSNKITREKIGDKNWEADTRWSGEKGDRKLTTPTPIQKDLQKAGFKDEQLIKLMEGNQKFQADRPKVNDLLKIFKKR